MIKKPDSFEDRVRQMMAAPDYKPPKPFTGTALLENPKTGALREVGLEELGSYREWRFVGAGMFIPTQDKS